MVKMEYVKKVNFLFLVIGHTKNAADHLCNPLKFLYRQDNIFTMEDLSKKLDGSEKVTVHAAVEDDFFDFDTFLSYYYRQFAKKVKQNHIFSCTSENRILTCVAIGQLIASRSL